MPLTTTQYLPEVVLTKAQKRDIDWAAGAMVDFWKDAEERALEGEATCDCPIIITKRGALVAARRGVLEDLKYRLTEQLCDMTDDLSHAQALAAQRSARNAWDAVAAVAAANGIADVEGK
jgi:hypothetical protein